MEDLLASLLDQRSVKSSFEIIVIENNPEPKHELQRLIRHWENKLPIRWIHAAQNGLHHARHAGVGAANGEYLLFVDDDVRMPPTWLCSFEQFFNSSNAICAGGKVLPEWAAPPSVMWEALPGSIFSLLDYGDEILELDVKQGINGCNFAIRKDAIYKYGGFHPDGFSDPSKRWLRGDGEYGLIQKIKTNGEKIYYLPSAVLYHRIPASRMESKSIHRLFQNHGISWAYSFARKYHCSVPALMSLLIYGLVMSTMHLLRSAVLYNSTVRVDTFYVTRYFAYAQYVYRLWKDARFRKYVRQDNYLEV